MARLLHFAALAARIALVAAAAVLASCGGIPTHPINPPNASIQLLEVQPDGRWKISIRLENFSDKTVHYSTLKANLRISGVDTAEISLQPEMDIPGLNADVVETTLTPSSDLLKAFALDVKAPGGAPYEIKGTIGIPAASKDFKFEHKSRLSPVPGIPNQYH
ncbi:MAG: hypothetical protein J0I77_22645 [Rudaea sp.]|uniref:hypothetical protein n=1 Tax=unclassified Rudaea TaxID=2627037 RepID=UPI0010F4F35B|nr:MULTISPECIES: hypothetical protein [unclassified Rudaea]MBN8888529.1 hypothetical protein [Rudaea sp.]MBR0343925.1 hypothetical protein [Rudaea sp.]